MVFAVFWRSICTAIYFVLVLVFCFFLRNRSDTYYAFVQRPFLLARRLHCSAIEQERFIFMIRVVLRVKALMMEEAKGGGGGGGEVRG